MHIPNSTNRRSPLCASLLPLRVCSACLLVCYLTQPLTKTTPMSEASGEHNPYILPTTTPPDTDDDDGIHELDLDKVITAEFDDAQWLIEPIVPAHRAIALYAAGKTGKSLLVLDFVAAAASGRPILGGYPTRNTRSTSSTWTRK